MEVILAGYNVDADIIAKLKNGTRYEKDITPETIAAAYARISRSPKRVDELRIAAQEEVEAARHSNKNIVFDMGHSSIAEHAVFNIDVVGISRLLVEEIQRFRLCSFTEKSQRYVSFKDDFVIPEEIKKTSFEKLFIETVKMQNSFYQEATAVLVPYILSENKDIVDNPGMRLTLEGWAKEDARYALSLATETQFGMTINARNLELMLRRLSALSLSEAHGYAAKLFEVTKNITPSLIRYTAATAYDKNSRSSLKEAIGTFASKSATQQTNISEVTLLDVTPEADNNLLSALLFTSSDMSMKECRQHIVSMSNAQKKKVFFENVNQMVLFPTSKKEVLRATFAHMESFSTPLREFENINLLFELVVSASCFAQLKRHRMATILCQPYNLSLKVKVPPIFAKTGLKEKFQKLIKETDSVYRQLAQANIISAPYILTNAHRRRVLMSLNARELYHISRLRMDTHAQWDIRNITTTMVKQASTAMPLTMQLATGKNNFAKLHAMKLGKLVV